MLCQSTGASASNTRDSKVPLAVYGVMRTQLTVTLPPNGLKSLAAIGRIGPGTVMACDATRLASTEKSTGLAFQSMRKRCGAPTTPRPRNGSIAALPVFDRAFRAPPLIVLKMAHGSNVDPSV